MDLTAHIKASGLTRAEICRKVGISAPMLSLMESGERRPGPETAAKLAAALGVTAAELRPDLAEVFAPRAMQQ